jgi:hypothetical protein
LTHCLTSAHKIIGAPAFFPTVWGWIKRWFDPVTTSKIFILSAAEVKPTLTSFMDPSSIPKQYGGELDWQWGDMPNLDEPARELVGALETPPAEGETKPSFTKGPVLFKGDHVEILGKVNGKSRQRTVPVPMPAKEQESTNTPDNTELEAKMAATSLAPATSSTEQSDVQSENENENENEKVALDNVAAEKVANGDSRTVSA